MKKVLLLNVNRTGWHSGNMVYDMMAIERGADTKVYGPGWPGYDTTDLPSIIGKLYGNDKPDIIYSYFTPNERVGDVYMQHYNIPESLRNFPTNFNAVKDVVKVFGLSDFWARKPSKFSNDLGGADFDYCFCCFTPPYASESDFFAFFDDKIKEKMKFLAHPRCIDTSCYKDYGLPKKYDIITVGAMWRFYRFRMKMHQYLEINHQDMGVRYKNYRHCGVNYGHNGFVREKYAQAINESNMLVSCGGRYHLAFNKIFEAMSCNTLYVGERPYGEKELHMEDGVNYIAVEESNFADRIKYYIDHPDEMKEIAKNGKEMCDKYHSIDARAKDFENLLEEVLCKK